MARKRNLRKKSRCTVKNYIHEFHRFGDPFGLPKYSHRQHRNSTYQPRSKKHGLRFTKEINCNSDFQFSHSLSELQSLPSDYLLNRTVHLLFSNHCIPFVGRLTCISHCGFIRIADLKISGLTAKHKLCRFNTADLMESRWNMANSKWFHYKCIGRVMVYEESTRKFRDITSMVRDLMKFKMVQWLKVPATSNVMTRFNEEQDKCNFHVMLLRKYHTKQRNQMRFEEWEMSEIIEGYKGIGRDLNGMERVMERNQNEEKTVIKAKEDYCGFMAWDNTHILKMSKKMSKGTRTC